MKRALAVLLLLGACGVAAAASKQRPHVAFFNHSFAVLDAETADAIEHSDYLKTFGVFETRTTRVSGGESWKGRYLAGKQTYLEMFGPGDVKDGRLGDTGVAVSPDKAGGVAAITAALHAQGIAHPDAGRRARQFGTDQIPWFDFVSAPGETKALSVWAMEYVPGYFDDPRTGREPADHPGDISRERYQTDAYEARLMRDVLAVEIACPSEDIKPALAMFTAAGFRIHRTRDRLEASDGSTTVILDAEPSRQAGWRRIVFALNAPAAEAHVERLGRSTLVVGPGDHAVWVFSPR